MNKNFFIAAVAGTVVLMIVGYVLYGMLLTGVVEANQGPAGNIMVDPPNWMWLILGQFFSGVFLALMLGWKGASDPVSGAKTGAIVGVLMALAIGFTWLGTTTINTLNLVLIDAAVAIVHFGSAGAVIGLLLGKGEA